MRTIGILINLCLWKSRVISMDMHETLDYFGDFDKIHNQEECQDFNSCDFQAGFFNITMQGISGGWENGLELESCSKKCQSNPICVGFNHLEHGLKCQLLHKIIGFDPDKKSTVSGFRQLSDIEVLHQDQIYLIPFDPKAAKDKNSNNVLESSMQKDSKDFEKFVQEPLNDKPVYDVYGLPRRFVSRLRIAGYVKAIDLVRKFVELKKDVNDFLEWMKNTFRIPSKLTQQISSALERWCANYPTECSQNYFDRLETRTISSQLLMGDCKDLDDNMGLAKLIQDGLCKCTPKAPGSSVVGFSQCSRRIPKFGRDSVAVCLFSDLGMIYRDPTLQFRTIIKTLVLKKQFGNRLTKQCEDKFSQPFYVRFPPGSMPTRNSGFKALSEEINKFVICIQQACPNFGSVLPIANLLQSRG